MQDSSTSSKHGSHTLVRSVPRYSCLVRFFNLPRLLAVCLLMSNLPNVSPVLGEQPNWEAELREQLPLLGHRNWIVIADSAYPAQTSPGIQTIWSNADHLEVLETVLKAVDEAPHVAGVVHLDKELHYVSENFAPGVKSFRENLLQQLQAREIETMPHERIIAELDKAGQTFRVLVIKTTLTVPYTSVFLRLDCGYWNANDEQALRKAMAE